VNVRETRLPGVLLVEPEVFHDTRGLFIETFHTERYRQQLGVTAPFVQDSFSRSLQGVLRGMHFQRTLPQGKLVRVSRGRIFDVAVDVRPTSKTFGEWVGVELNEDSHRQLWIPPGFAHGFCVMSDTADVHYKCTDYYAPHDELGLLWSCKDVGIDWPITEPILSAKDASLPGLNALSAKLEAPPQSSSV
jgi:dTDP-4-dehydrorhamnose 3,5-epimerase